MIDPVSLQPASSPGCWPTPIDRWPPHPSTCQSAGPRRGGARPERPGRRPSLERARAVARRWILAGRGPPQGRPLAPFPGPRHFSLRGGPSGSLLTCLWTWWTTATALRIYPQFSGAPLRLIPPAPPPALFACVRRRRRGGQDRPEVGPGAGLVSSSADLLLASRPRRRSCRFDRRAHVS